LRDAQVVKKWYLRVSNNLGGEAFGRDHRRLEHLSAANVARSGENEEAELYQLAQARSVGNLKYPANIFS